MRKKNPSAEATRSVPELNFKASKQLRTLFLEEFDLWSKKNRAGMDELARRCGLSPAYISQIGRYGRIPSKSALILLALQFELRPAERIFTAAGISESWPLEEGLLLRKGSALNDSFLTLNLDMEGLRKSVREVIREEVRPRNIKDLTRGRPLKIGVNPLMEWNAKEAKPSQELRGFFPEVCEMLALSLQCNIETHIVEYSSYEDLFARGELDMFGPLLFAPTFTTHSLFTTGLYRAGLSALFRKKPHPELKPLPEPKHLQDVIDGDYQIAVLRKGRSHLVCKTLLKKSDDQLILCDSHEEAFERITLKGIRRAAHLFFVNSVTAHDFAEGAAREVSFLFSRPETIVDRCEVSAVIRPDWPELVTRVNEAFGFLIQTGALEESLNRWLPKEYRHLIEPIHRAQLHARPQPSKSGK